MLVRGTVHAIKIAAALSVGLGLATSAALADERYNQIRDPRVLTECGACHMAFQPQMLPKRSWEKLMDGLADHFGEDASLAPEAEQPIRAYLVANAADAKWWGGRFMRGLGDDETPLRITELRHWIREHAEDVPRSAWSDPKVKSKANCPACHRRAEQGDYDDD